MFNNLIESDLHTKENARRSWFFLGTLVTYALSLMIAGVVSIYAYDARLEEQTNEYSVTFIPPVTPAEAPPRRSTEPRPNAGDTRHIPERAQPIAPISNSTKPPDEISSTPPKVRELPASGPVAITGRDRDYGTTGITGSSTGNNTPTGGTPSSIRVEIEEPPPQRVAPTPPPPKILKVSTVLNGRAIQLPKPPYPQLAKIAGVTGVVTVQVLIDESGRVLSAQAISGHPLLRSAAAQAARQARFSPTMLGDQAVKVSGVITYNFTL
jgi:TonB family protein